MKKFICVILALVCMFSLFACGSGEGSASDKDIDINAVKEQIISQLGIDGAMDLPAERLLALYGIDEADIASSACYVTMDGVFPDEIVMIKAVDTEAAKRVEEKLNTRLDEIKVQSQSYDPENYAVAQECKVLKEGNVVALFMSPKHADMEEILLIHQYKNTPVR